MNNFLSNLGIGSSGKKSQQGLYELCATAADTTEEGTEDKKRKGTDSKKKGASAGALQRKVKKQDKSRRKSAIGEGCAAKRNAKRDEKSAKQKDKSEPKKGKKKAKDETEAKTLRRSAGERVCTRGQRKRQRLQ